MPDQLVTERITTNHANVRIISDDPTHPLLHNQTTIKESSTVKRLLALSTQCFTASVIALLISFSGSAIAEGIALPEKLPELKVTEDETLGTLAKDFGLEPGETVDDFSLPNQFGKTVKTKKLRKKTPLLVIFYRGGWCPYCNRQIYELTEAWPEFEKRGVTPVLISADKPEAAALASRTYDIPFPVLSDPKLVAHNLFKVVMTLDAETLKKYEKFGVDLEEWSGETHASFAVSSAFYVDKSGMVKWAHSSLDYSKRPSIAQLLSVIDDQG